jgi:hypothetical protein
MIPTAEPNAYTRIAFPDPSANPSHETQLATSPSDLLLIAISRVGLLSKTLCEFHCNSSCIYE